MSELSRRRFLYLSGGAAATAAGVGVWAALLRGESEKGILVPPSTTLSATSSTTSTTTTAATTTSVPTPPQNPVVVIVQMAQALAQAVWLALATILPQVRYQIHPTTA